MKIQELLEADFKGNFTNKKVLLKQFTDLKEPLSVIGNVDISNCDIKFKSLPLIFENVTGNFDCSDNELTNLIGAPKDVGGRFDCSFNKISTLKGCPNKVGTNFTCSGNLLKELDYLPEYIGDMFLFGFLPLESLVGIHKKLKHCKNIMIHELLHLKEGGLGLLLIDGVERISVVDTPRHGLPALRIISKYVGQGKKGIMLCHAELIENGYEAFAKL